MQRTDEPNAGFTGGEPRIGVNPNYPEINVEQVMERAGFGLALLSTPDRASEGPSRHYLRRVRAVAS